MMVIETMVTNSELIRDFVNTRDLLDHEEHLATPDELVRWLASKGLVPGRSRATATELEQARELREGLRALLLANNDVEVDTGAAAAVLDRAAQRARVELRFHDGGAELVSRAGGVAGAFGRVVAAVHGAMTDGSWVRLKACRARDCEWAFEDHARNQSRAWCSMKSCGNREKARTYRERHAHR
jgi:predicted RNA-binding Zn ribbon-like protein